MRGKHTWNRKNRGDAKRGTAPLTALLALCLLGLTTIAQAQEPAGEDGGADAPAAAEGEGAGAGTENGDLDAVGSDGPRSLATRARELWQGLVIRWEMGGPTMYALAFLVVVALLFVIDRLVSLRRGAIAPRGLADQANELWQQGEYDRIIELTEGQDNALGRVIRFIVEHRRARYEPLNSGAEDIAARAFDSHTRRNYPLLVVGTLAPLLGLMGTIFGLMGAFASIGVYGSMDDPSVLAGDIGEAMVTTATGLIIAVPALALFHYFRSRQSRYASLLSEEVSNLMHAWFLTDTAPAPAHATASSAPPSPPPAGGSAASRGTSESE